MADQSPLAGLLDRAGHVFSLVEKLANAFTKESEQLGRSTFVDSTAWSRHEREFHAFMNSILELGDATMNPPYGFGPVAEVLKKTAEVAKQIRDEMNSDDGRTWQSFLDYRFALNSIVDSSKEVMRSVREGERRQDPFDFLNQSSVVIDTTPIVPMPPAGEIQKAALAIPGILATLPPNQNRTIELVASLLVRRLQDASHSLAAAHWSIHESVRAGRLLTGQVEVGLPSVAVPSGNWNGTAFDWYGGGKGTKIIPKGRPTPFDCFKVIATDALWEWWRSSKSDKSDRETQESHCEPESANAVQGKPKQRNAPGEARNKLIAALTLHHKYSVDSCLCQNPITINALARLAGISPSTAFAFFETVFQGHENYIHACQDTRRLIGVLKLLNDEFIPRESLKRGRPKRHKDNEE